MSKLRWTKEEDQILIKYYSRTGKLLSRLLNKKPEAVKLRASKLGLKLSKESCHIIRKAFSRRTNRDCILSSRILNLVDPEVAYFLGLLWADGCCSPGRYVIRLTCAVKDSSQYLKFLPSILQAPEWRKSFQVPNNPKHVPIVTYQYNSRRFSNLLQQWGLHVDRKDISILFSRIPESLKCFFLLGLVDGDGCWAGNYKGPKRLSISASVDQDWTSLIKYFREDLLLNPTVKLCIKKGGASSELEFRRQSDIDKLGSFIYAHRSPEVYNLIGLDRKYQKWLSISSSQISNKVGELTAS